MERSIFEILGGPEPFWRLARAFYGRVDSSPNPTFRAMFPADLEEPIRNQAEFLIQYFGGPPTYSERKGHPRLRMRHAHFHIDESARAQWMAYMREALSECAFPEEVHTVLLRYLDDTSHFLVNRS